MPLYIVKYTETREKVAILEADTPEIAKEVWKNPVNHPNIQQDHTETDTLTAKQIDMIEYETA